MPAAAKVIQKTKNINRLQSLNVIRNMIRVSVSEICYLRNLFPEELFKERVYADMNIKCLAPQKEDTRNDVRDALTITQWLEEGVFEALDKKFLEALKFCIYSVNLQKEPEKLLESYTYKVTHDGCTGTSQLETSFTGKDKIDCSPENVKAQAIQMIRSLVSITNNLEPLPTNRLITMKLMFNSSCPLDWKPKYFKQALEEEETMQGPRLKLDIGCLITPHHIVTMELEAIEDNLDAVSERAASQKTTYAEDPIKEEPVKDDPSIVAESDTAGDITDDGEMSECSQKFPLSQTPTFSSQKSQSNAKDDVLSFVLLKETLDERELMTRFKDTINGTDLLSYFKEFCREKVLSLSKDNPTKYDVFAFDDSIYYAAIHGLHGKLKRHITPQALSKQLSITNLQAKSLLLRMEMANMVERGSTNSFLGYKVIFTEQNRALIRKAVEFTSNKAKHRSFSQEKIGDEEMKEESDPTENNPIGSKRKAIYDGQISQRSFAADFPILQVKKALKKRKIALKHVN